MKTGTKRILIGILPLILGAVLAVLLFRRFTEGIGIIGGADAPTFIFMLTHGTGRIALALFIAGAVMIISGAARNISGRK